MTRKPIENKCGNYEPKTSTCIINVLIRMIAKVQGENYIGFNDCTPGENNCNACQKEAKRQEEQSEMEQQFAKVRGTDQPQEEASEGWCDWHDGSHDGAQCKRHPNYHYFSMCNAAIRSEARLCRQVFYESDRPQEEAKQKPVVYCTETGSCDYRPILDRSKCGRASIPCPKQSDQPRDGEKEYRNSVIDQAWPCDESDGMPGQQELFFRYNKKSPGGYQVPDQRTGTTRPFRVNEQPTWKRRDQFKWVIA